MCQHLSDRARKVLQLANQEAQRCNHEYVGTEHILLGLIKEREGVAANVLVSLDVDLASPARDGKNLTAGRQGSDVRQAANDARDGQGNRARARRGPGSAALLRRYGACSSRPAT